VYLGLIIDGNSEVKYKIDINNMMNFKISNTKNFTKFLTNRCWWIEIIKFFRISLRNMVFEVVNYNFNTRII